MKNRGDIVKLATLDMKIGEQEFLSFCAQTRVDVQTFSIGEGFG